MQLVLVIYFIHNRVHMSIPISQSIPPPHSPFCIHVCSLCLCLYLCFTNKFTCTIFLDSTSFGSVTILCPSLRMDRPTLNGDSPGTWASRVLWVLAANTKICTCGGPALGVKAHTWRALLSSWGSVAEEGFGWRHYPLVSGGAPSAPSLIPTLSRLSDHQAGRVWAQHASAVHSQG